MLQEALSFLAEKFTAAAANKVWERGDRLIAFQGGTFQEFDRGPLRLVGRLLSLSSLIAFA